MTTAVKKNHKRFRFSIRSVTTDIPPMVFLINPSEMSVEYKKLITRTRTLGGFVEEHWGDDLDNISCTGKLAMFIDSDNGLTVSNRRTTQSLSSFMEFVEIYKSNGVQKNSENDREFELVGQVRLDYDFKIYDGYFESLNVNELAEDPFTFQYEFVFKVIRSFGEYSVTKPNSVVQVLSFIQSITEGFNG